MHCKLEKYGLSDSSREQNIRRISLLLDTRSAAEVCVGRQCVGGEGKMKNCAVVDEKAGRMSCNKVEEEEGERGGISDRREENSTMGNDGEKGRVVVEEEDRELLFVSRQIMLDISELIFVCVVSQLVCEPREGRAKSRDSYNNANNV